MRSYLHLLLALLAAPLVAGQTFQLSNTTHAQSGTPNFVVGDGFVITISAASPYSSVILTSTHNGSSGTATLGTTDGSGNWSLSGSQGSSTAGTWNEVWSVGTSQVANVSFFVLSDPPSVTLTNTSNGGLNFSSGADFVAGDGYEVSLTSGSAAAGQPVTLTSTQNGSSGTATIWTTDANGSLTVTGTQGSSLVGDWTEQWYVGGLPASTFLEFEIIPPPTGLIFNGVSITSAPSDACPSPYIGVFGDIEYQVQNSSGTYDTSVPLVPYEDLSYPDGGSYSGDIGPASGYSDSSEFTDEYGVFHDVPSGWCLTSPYPYPPGTTVPTQYQVTQDISIYIGNNSYPVYTNVWYISSGGVGHGTQTNNNNISISR